MSLGRDDSRILASSEMELTDNILDVAGFEDLTEFIKGIFQRYCSVKHAGQLVTHGKTVSGAKT